MSFNRKVLIAEVKKLFAHTSADLSKADGLNSRILGGAGTRIEMSSDGKKTFEGVVPEGGGATLAIIGDGLQAYEAIVSECPKDPDFAAMAGRRTIGNAIDELLRHHALGSFDDAGIGELVNSHLLESIRSKLQDFTAFLPVVNLEVTYPLKLGNATFLPISAVTLEARKELESHQFVGSYDEQQQQREMILGVFDSSFSWCRGVVRVTGRAHADFASDVAMGGAIAALNVLRSLALLFRKSLDSSWRIGLPSEIHNSRWGFGVFLGSPPTVFQLPQILIGNPLPFALNKTAFDYFVEHCHLEAIAAILAAGPRESFAKALVEGFDALGRATLAPTKAMRLAAATVAMERVLFRDKENNTVEKFCDRFAFGFFDGQQIQRAANAAKDLYNVRSEIVHAARNNVTEDQVLLMEHWAIFVLLDSVSRHKDFRTHDDFCQSLQQMKYKTAR
jgi:hypothetical protein